jgi:hypothetical protein
MCTFYNRNSPSFILGDFRCWMKHSVWHDRPVCLTQSFALNSSFLSHYTIFCAGSFRHTQAHTILCCLSEREEGRQQGTLSERVLVLVARDLLANSSGSASKNKFMRRDPLYSVQSKNRGIVIVVPTGPKLNS